MKKHWRYLAARYGALPVVWCAAGEVNLPYYLEKGFPQGGEKQGRRSEEAAADALDRPLAAAGDPVRRSDD